jgi:outer membrane protein assembly factor BamB
MRRAVVLLWLFAGSSGPASSGSGGPRFEADPFTSIVVRRDAGGKVAWSARLNGPLAQTLVWDGWRVYVSHKRGVTALDAATSKPLWHAAGPASGLLVSGSLLLATGSQGEGGWVVGRGAASGVEVFKVRLAGEPTDSWSVREVAGLFLVQELGSLLFGGEEEALVIDRLGGVRRRFPRGVIGALAHRKTAIFLYCDGVAGFTPDAEARWTTPLAEGDGQLNGGLVEAGADVVAFRYCPLADSGVQLLRLNVATGEVVWRARCAPLGRKHSKYEHAAKVTVEGERLRVTSRGSYGTFVEGLDVRTGKQLQRTANKTE